MRLRSLELLRFGPFSDRVLDFCSHPHPHPHPRPHPHSHPHPHPHPGPEPGPAGLHVIQGDNEAGKSTALRAVTALLYGFPHQTPDDHRHARTELRVGAEIEDDAGARLRFVRRKGNKNTLLGPDGEPLPDDVLDPFLGGVTQADFERMYGLDHPRLVEGGADLLQGRGELGQALFGAATGLRGVRALAERLADEAGAIFKRNASKARLNQALKRHQEARRRAQQVVLKPAEWERARRERDEAAEALERLREEERAARARRAERQRLLDALPDLRARAALQQQQAELEPVVLLPSDAGARRVAAGTVLRSNALRARQLADERERVDARLAELEVPEALLALESRLEDLDEASAVTAKALRDRAEHMAKIEAGRAELATLLAALPGAPSLDALAERQLDAAQQTRIRSLAREGEAVRAALDAQRQAEHASLEALEAAHAARAALGPELEMGPLRAVVEAARAEGNLEAQQRERRARIAQAREEADRAVAALPFWQGDLETLAALPVPGEATLRVHAERLERLDAERLRLEERRRRLQEEREEVERELEGLIGAASPPGPEDLAAARARRDGIWRGIRSVWLDRASPEAPPELLAARFEAASGEADATGDRLFAEHERVARTAGLRRRLERSERQAQALAAAEAALEEEGRTHAEDWRSAWAEAGLSPRAPKEMQGWLAVRRELIDQLGRITALESERDAADRDLTRHREACAASLAGLGEALPDATAGLTALLARAGEVLEREQEAGRIRERCEADVERAEQGVRRARAELAAAARHEADWRERWGRVVSLLALGPDCAPAEADAVLDRLDGINERARTLEGLRERVRHIDRDAEDFVASVFAIAREAGEDPGAAPEQVGESEIRDARARAADLVRALRDGLQARGLRESLLERRDEVDRERQEIGREREAAEANLAELTALAAVPDVEALEAAEQRSARKRQVQERLAEVEERLARGDEPIAALEAVAEQVETSDLEMEIAELDRDLETIATRRDQAAQRLAAVEHALEALDGSDAAAEAAAEAEAALAEIDRLAREYAEKKAAELLLRREVQRFAEENQDPILAQTSDYFGRITLGRFDGVVSGYSEADEPVIRCRRGSGELVDLDGLSDGTRDQLYLSLRLAALVHHAGRAESMPLVVDDVLLTFDDARAAATLGLMGELAERAQILFFTHHARLVELAREAVGEPRLRVHSLEVD